MKKKINEEIKRMQVIAGIIKESEDGDAREIDKVEEARLSAKEKVDRAITKHLPQLTQLLKDRKRDQEDMDAYEGLEELVGKIAKQVGLSPDEPWMESEWSTGEMSPVKAIKGMREEFIATLEDPDYDASASTDTFDYFKSMKDQYGIKKGGPVKNINKLKEEEVDNMSDEEKIDMWYWDSNPEIENLSQKQIEDGIKAHQEEWLGSKQLYNRIEDYFEDVERQGDWYGDEFDDEDDDDLDSEIEEGVGADVPSNVMKFAERKGVTEEVKQVAEWAKMLGKKISGGTAIGKYYGTLVLDLSYQGSEVYIDTDSGDIEVNGYPVASFEDFQEAVKTYPAVP